MSSREGEYEHVFSFVKDRPLRSHLSDAVEIAVELSAVAKQYPAPLRSTFYKTSIIHIASIIEGLLHYCALQALGDICEHTEWTYRNNKILHEFDEKHVPPNLQIIASERFKKLHKLSGYIDFQDLNKLCLREDIIDDDLFSEIDKVRKLRNKIHLFGLKFVDRKYSYNQVDKIAETAGKVMGAVKNKLK